MTGRRPGEALTDLARAQRVAYAATAEDERPLGGYAAAMAVFTAVTALSAASARQGRGAPSARDLLTVGLATHKLARIISKDAVTSPLRAPFTRYAGPAGPGEVREEVRGHGVRHAVGELLTCPFCLSPWVASGLLAGLNLAPRLTRHVTAVFSAVTVADVLQMAYAALERRAQEP